MKHRIIRLLAAALALILAGAAALAEVRTTGNVWMRAEPDKESAQITSFPEDTRLDYLGETRVDERGVAWYKVEKGGQTGWVSSRYSELIGEQSVVTEDKTAVEGAPAAAGSDWFDGAGVNAPDDNGNIEVSGYYHVDLQAAAAALGLEDFRKADNSEVPNQYYDDALTLAGNRIVEYVGIAAPGYAVFGACVGMNSNEATAKLVAAGLDYAGGNDATLVFEHRAEDDAGYVNEQGHDSCVNLYLVDGAVGEIDWSSYTG